MTDIALWVFIGLCFLAAMSGMFFGPGEWYRNLKKPSWQPPDWLFGPAWTILYAMIAASAWLVWRSGTDDLMWPMTIWGIQLALNALWSAIFFGMKRMDIALFECGILWIMILATIMVFYGINMTAALLLVPYFAWVSFAFVLNMTVWQLNRPGSAPDSSV